MATWTYSDWITQSTDALRLSRLRLHIQEVSDKLAGFTQQAAMGLSAQRPPLQQYLDMLIKREEQLALATGDSSAAGIIPIVLAKPLTED